MIKVLDVKALENFKLLLTFSTQEQKIFDVNPYIFGDWFGKLKDESYFRTVRPSGRTVVWEGDKILLHTNYTNFQKVYNPTSHAF